MRLKSGGFSAKYKYLLVILVFQFFFKCKHKFYTLLATVFFNSVCLLLIRLIIYEIKSPIENVVRIVHTTKAIIGGIIIRNLSSVTVSPIIRQKVVQIIKFTTVEYLKEVRSNDFPFSIFL